MCELLISNNTTYTHADPKKDKAGVYKKGDIVLVMEDGHKWGRKECLPKFFVVKIPGVTKEEFLKYAEDKREVTAYRFNVRKRNSEKIEETVLRRKHRIPIEDILTDDDESNILKSDSWVDIEVTEDIIVEKE